MSAYGELSRPTWTTTVGKLRARSYLLPEQTSNTATRKSLTVLPLVALPSNGQDEKLHEAVLEYLSELFDAIVEEGRSYPQEGKVGLEGFKRYFLSHDFFVGITDADCPHDSVIKGDDNRSIMMGIEREENITLTDLIAGRDLGSCLAGMFYIKPNYPGRSSHCCNAGFVVNHRHRGQKIGKSLAISYLYYAPRLGYRSSVFNLVYTNNLASMAIWDSLGFKRVGLIPEAGRLKVASSPDGQKSNEVHEWVDAIVYWKKFSE
ncbi:hypothetical protein CROQUDRAFT_36247 [Cronartium quercuum f. sp. fusiforme G11]|uniref:N-acetyltransferase domain-containing protein n=1 Tax=Cronartium quercuum f. sp. fusiforme G11 TaxID=708437 RepID=A0A9P6NYH8_9BASI|nr:hypothetical protein CROQUDRAFT_36247 [Cronartium quercuum f. sp. fusiforme G11]